MPEVMTHDFLMGSIKILILHYAEKESVYGKEFHEVLLKHGYELSYGIIYPLFHMFEKKGYLACEDVNVNGKIRKYYNITKTGKEALAKARSKTKELFEILYEVNHQKPSQK
jgi:PadR family transcriptional regulator PadR